MKQVTALEPLPSLCHPFLAEFRCARLRFQLRALSPIELPGEKGSAFHGALGRLLHQQSPLHHRFFYGPTRVASGPAGGRDPPRPFVLRPPVDTATEYPAGSELSFELVLFGDAIGHWSLWLVAVAALGREGLGKNRGRFELAKVETLLHDGSPRSVYDGETERLADSPEAVTGAAIADAWSRERCAAVTLHLATRLRLKDHQQLVRKPPPFYVLVQRLLERAEALGSLYHRAMLLGAPAKQGLVDQARAVEIAGHDLCWDDWSRYSGRQHAWMKFGGLLGTITYAGDVGPFLPWLALGEWMHLGGKTSFGLGRHKIGLQPEV